MNFVRLVESVLNESPDTIKVGSKYYSFAEKKGNPITFIIDKVLIVPDKEDVWSYAEDKMNSYEAKFGRCIAYSSTVFPKKYRKKFNIVKQEDNNDKVMTHANLDDVLAGLQHDYSSLKSLGIHLFNPKTSIDQYFSHLQKQSPNASYYLKNYEDHKANEKGRIWTLDDKVFVSLWLFDKKMFKQYIIPFVKHLNPQMTDNDIFIEGQDEETWIKVSELEAYTEEVKPFQKEIAELLMQLHMASGDERKKNEIKLKIKEICQKNNLDPKKYGISDEEIRSSETTAQKLLGKSKDDTIASLKSRIQTSENLQKNIFE